MKRWLTLAAALFAAAILAFVALAMARGLAGFLSAASPEAGGAPDPMFQEPAARVTRPPSLTGEDEAAPTARGDASANWVYQTLTPLDP